MRMAFFIIRNSVYCKYENEEFVMQRSSVGVGGGIMPGVGNDARDVKRGVASIKARHAGLSQIAKFASGFLPSGSSRKDIKKFCSAGVIAMVLASSPQIYDYEGFIAQPDGAGLRYFNSVYSSRVASQGYPDGGVAGEERVGGAGNVLRAIDGKYLKRVVSSYKIAASLPAYKADGVIGVGRQAVSLSKMESVYGRSIALLEKYGSEFKWLKRSFRKVVGDGSVNNAIAGFQVAMAYVESSCDYKDVSESGAVGVLQVMPSTLALFLSEDSKSGSGRLVEAAKKLDPTIVVEKFPSREERRKLKNILFDKDFNVLASLYVLDGQAYSSRIVRAWKESGGGERRVSVPSSVKVSDLATIAALYNRGESKVSTPTGKSTEMEWYSFKIGAVLSAMATYGFNPADG